MYISPTITVELKRRVPTDLVTLQQSRVAVFQTGVIDISQRVISYPDIELKSSDSEGTLFQYNQSYYELEVDNKDGYFNSNTNTSSVFHSVIDGMFDGNSIYTSFGSQVILTVNTGGTNQIKCKFLIETIEHRRDGINSRTVLVLKRPHYDFLNTTFLPDSEETVFDDRKGRVLTKLSFMTPFADAYDILADENEFVTYGSRVDSVDSGTQVIYNSLSYYYSELLQIEVDRINNTAFRLGQRLMVYTPILSNRQKVDEYIRYSTILGLILSDSVNSDGDTVLRYTERKPQVTHSLVFQYLPVDNCNILRINSVVVNDTTLYAPRFEFSVPNVDAVLRDFEFTFDGIVITSDVVSEYVESVFLNTFFYRQTVSSGLAYSYTFANLVFYIYDPTNLDLAPTNIAILGSDGQGNGTAVLITGYDYYPNNFYFSVEDRTASSVESVIIDFTHIFPISRVDTSIQAPTSRLKTRLLNLVSPSIDVTNVSDNNIISEVDVVTDSTLVQEERGGVALWLDQNYGNPKKLYDITLVMSNETINIRPMDSLILRSSVDDNNNESENFDDTILVLTVRFDTNTFEVHIRGEVI